MIPTSGALDWKPCNPVKPRNQAVKPLPPLNFLTALQARINIARLMLPQSPQFVEPLRLARQGAELHGRLLLKDMPRLQEAVYDAVGEVEYALAFRREANDFHSIIGRFSATVSMTCQRCLQPMPVAVTHDVQLGVVRGEEEAKRLPAEYEPLQMDDGPVKLRDLIEDEMLLALPFAPVHPQAQCPLANAGGPGDKDQSQPDRQYPFTDLAALKRRHD